MSSPTAQPTPDTTRTGSVLDPAWEDALRAGQTEDGGTAGSVDAELAVIYLLRHARAPEALMPAALDRLWSVEIVPAISPLPWWKRRWLWGVVPAAATAALLIVVLRDGSGDRAVVAASAPAATPGGTLVAAATPSSARALEQQFARLEGDARRDLGGRVDRGRGVMRSQLLAQASAGDKP